MVSGGLGRHRPGVSAVDRDAGVRRGARSTGLLDRAAYSGGRLWHGTGVPRVRHAVSNRHEMCFAARALPLLPGHEIAIAALAVLGVIAAAVYVVRARRLPLAIIMVWLAAPFAVLLAISIVRPLFLDRYVLGTTYPLYLLLGLGVTSAWKHRRVFVLAASVLAVVVSIDAYNVRYVLAHPTNPNWKTPMRDFQAVYRPGDSVAYYPGVVKAIIQPYMRPGWEPAMERPIWLHTYIDIPRWEHSKGNWTDDQLRNSALKTLIKGRHRVWIVAQTYVGIWNLWNFFTVRHWNLVLNQEYGGNTFVELWTKGPPSALGPAAAPVDDFGSGWRFSGNVTVDGHVARTAGQATLTRTFRVKPQTLYTVNTAHSTSLWPEPKVQVLVYRACTTQTDGTLTGVGSPIGTYPQIEHFDLWTTAHWYMKPFGFITPPGADCAVMTFQTYRGVSRWRNIGVYEQR